MRYEPKHIERWVEFVNYEGEDFTGYYIGAQRNFWCTPCDRANFEYIANQVIDSGSPAESIMLVKFGDDMLVKRYYLFIHESADRALKMADMLAERAKRKGSLDPESEVIIDDKKVQKAWDTATLERKVRICQEAEVSIFLARRAAYPTDHPESDNIYSVLSEIA